MRFVITLLPALLLAACDRQAQSDGQAERQAAVTSTDADLVGKADTSQHGAAAPSDSFLGPDDRPLKLAKFRGRPVLVNLWATWCGPCVRELPSLDRLAMKTQERLDVVAVSQDGPNGDPRAYWDDKGFSQLQLYTDVHAGLTASVGGGMLPTTVLYDAKGREVWRVVGGLEWDGPKAAKLLAPYIG